MAREALLRRRPAIPGDNAFRLATAHDPVDSDASKFRAARALNQKWASPHDQDGRPRLRIDKA